ncbi:hypothetical protein LINPERHAP2_LOCUS31296 [Linum perenne]
MNRGEDFIGDADCGSTTAIGFLVGQREEESGLWLLVFRDGHGGVGAVEREISNCRGLVSDEMGFEFRSEFGGAFSSQLEKLEDLLCNTIWEKLDVIVFRKIKVSQNFNNGLSPHYIPKLNSYDIVGGCSILQETGYKFAYDDCHREK